MESQVPLRQPPVLQDVTAIANSAHTHLHLIQQACLHCGLVDTTLVFASGFTTLKGVSLCHSGSRMLVMRLPPSAPSTTTTAADVANYINRSNLNIQHTVATATGSLVQLVGSECPLQAASVAAAVAPYAPRHGWAAAGKASLRARATTDHLAVCTIVVFLGADAPDNTSNVPVLQQLGQLDSGSSMLEGVVRVIKAREEISAGFAAAGLVTTPQLAGAALIADTFAAVVAQVAMQPLADATGLPLFALAGARILLAAVQGHLPQQQKQSGNSGNIIVQLADINTPVKAWGWFSTYAAPYASTSIKSSQEVYVSNMGLWDWVADIAANAAQIQLQQDSAIPVVHSCNTGHTAFWNRFAQKADTYLLAAAPKSHKSVNDLFAWSDQHQEMLIEVAADPAAGLLVSMHPSETLHRRNRVSQVQ